MFWFALTGNEMAPAEGIVLWLRGYFNTILF